MTVKLLQNEIIKKDYQMIGRDGVFVNCFASAIFIE
jgi:hypothetical protein